MKDVWMAGAGFAFGWLMSKSWQDPGCQVGLAVFLILGAVLILTFALAVVGHGRKDVPPRDMEDDEEDHV